MIYLEILKKKKFAYLHGVCVFFRHGPTADMAVASYSTTSVGVALRDHTVMTKLRYLRKGKKRISGRNNQGRITVRRRGGGHKRNYRLVSFGFSFHSFTEPQVNSYGLSVRKNSLGENYLKQNKGLRGTLEYMVYDLVYDPNRSAPLALVAPIHSQGPMDEMKKKKNLSDALVSVTAPQFKYILAPKGIVPGDIIKIWNVSLGWRPLKSKEEPITEANSLRFASKRMALPSQAKDLMTLRPSLGDSLPLSKIPLGSIIHNIEEQPGKGGQYIRAGGGYGQILDILTQGGASSSLGQNGKVSHLGEGAAKAKKKRSKVLVRLPSGEKKWFPSNGRASIGAVSLRSVLQEGERGSPIIDEAVLRGANTTVSGSSSVFVGKKGDRKTLGKAGRSRWLGRRPKVRGVAMNPVDHPHGGGEGRTSGGRPSVTPWGRLTKGWKTRSAAKKKKVIRVI